MSHMSDLDISVQEAPPVRTAVLSGAQDLGRVRAYLPSNYSASCSDDGTVFITGRDSAGWTLDGYVLPRLASGNMFGTEVPIAPEEN